MRPVISIPSMNNPDAKIFQRLCNTKLDKYIFVRKNQYNMYKKHESNGWKVIVLPKWVDDLGSTRKATMLYFNKRGIDWVFQFDDDVAYIGNCELREDGWKWEYTGKEKIYFKDSVFKKWLKVAKEYNLSVSTPCHRFHDHHRHGNCIHINKSACIQCFLLHVSDIIRVGNYHRVRECGVEDYVIQYYLMKNGYLCGMIGNILFDSPAIGNPEKYPEYIEAFKKNVCDDPTYITTKVTRSGIPSIQFVWKNWDGYTVELEEN